MFQHDVNRDFLVIVMWTVLGGLGAGWPALVIIAWGRRPTTLGAIVWTALGLLGAILAGNIILACTARPGDNRFYVADLGTLLIAWSLYLIALARIRRHGAGAPAAET
jgi:hypothetical protein